MSSLIVEISKIDEVIQHPNADKLDIVRIKGWYCITQKDKFRVGDKCVYIPIDSILPKELEDTIFGIDSKIKLEKSRVRTIKIRGQISQGLVTTLELCGLNPSLEEGTDVAKELNITKFEPEEPEFMKEVNDSISSKKSGLKKGNNPHFKRYTDIENIKHYPYAFTSEDTVIITEKLHGTSFRCGWFPSVPSTLWAKIKKLVGLLPKWEFCYGSRGVQLQSKNYNGFYDKNIYGEIVKQYDLQNKLKERESVYGEIVGPSVQKGYHYGIKHNEYKLYVYDIRIWDDNTSCSEFLNYAEFEKFCQEKELEIVPKLYEGKFDYEMTKELTKGSSTIAPSQLIREGVVIKSKEEVINPCHGLGRKILKFISDDYLLNKNNTDFH